MELNFNHFSIKTQPGMEDDPVRAGFLMHRTDRWVYRVCMCVDSSILACVCA